MPIPGDPPKEDLYTHRVLDDPTRDLKIVEIDRNDGTRPYTILLHQFSHHGYLRLFQQLYSTGSWAFTDSRTLTSTDTWFAKYLWKELGLPGEFKLEELDIDLWMAPAVYREHMLNVLARKYGHGMVETLTSPVEPVTPASS